MIGEPFVIELEWWGDRTGRQIAETAARAAARHIVPETMHVYNPDWLDCVPGDCEASLFVSFRGLYRSTINAIRAAGIRVKTAGVAPEHIARADYRAMMDWLCASSASEET